MNFGFDVPEFWAFGIGTALLLLGLAYGGLRAGWLSPRERARTDSGTLEMPRERPRRSAADVPAALLPTHWWVKSEIGENG
jgi:hypothetical protein